MLKKTYVLKILNFSSLLFITFVQNRKHSHLSNLFNICFTNYLHNLRTLKLIFSSPVTVEKKSDYLI